MLPGITAMLRPGHTPGHTNWLIQSGGERLLIWGDIVHLAAVQLARPEARLIYDVDTDLARATRQQVLEWAANERLTVAGAHLGFPGFGRVERPASASVIRAESKRHDHSDHRRLRRGRHPDHPHLVKRGAKIRALTSKESFGGESEIARRCRNRDRRSHQRRRHQARDAGRHVGDAHPAALPRGRGRDRHARARARPRPRRSAISCSARCSTRRCATWITTSTSSWSRRR